MTQDPELKPGLLDAGRPNECVLDAGRPNEGVADLRVDDPQPGAEQLVVLEAASGAAALSAEDAGPNRLEDSGAAAFPIRQANQPEMPNASAAAKAADLVQSRETKVDQEPNRPTSQSAPSTSPLSDAKLPRAGARAWIVLAAALRRLGEGLARLPRPELRWRRVESSEAIVSPTEDAEPDVKAAAVADAAELLLLDNIRALRTARVEDVRVPRADIAFINHDMSLDEIVAKAREAGHSRFPVIGESQDEVLGMIHIKDLLWGDVDSQAFRVQDFMREVLFVAPSMPVLQLLQDMQLKRHHMALIVDEFGGIDGLVTIEDLVEEIVGDISDEYDANREPALLPQTDGTWIIDARYRIDELEERIGEFLTDDEREEDLDTLGGLVTHVAGRVPTRNELIEHDSGMRFLVVEADPRRIKRLRMRAKSLAAAKGLVSQTRKQGA